MVSLTETVLYSCDISLFTSFGIQKVEAKRSNILFIMTDQQRYGMLSCTDNRYVYILSLDQLAKDGVRFERNYCASPVSIPSRFAMITGRFAGGMGYTNNSAKPDALRVLPAARESSAGSLFRSASYETIYSGYPGFYCGRTDITDYGFTQSGMDFCDGPSNFAEGFFAGYRPEGDKPSFLYLSFVNPHDICYGAGFDPRFPDKLHPHQIAATQKYINFRKTLNEEEYRNQILPVPANMEPNGAYAEMRGIGSGPWSWTEEQWDFYRWMYCRFVGGVEKQIGRILTALADTGLAGSTIIVFTSGHGEMEQSHGLVFKSQLLGEATRTSLIIADPGIQKGIVDSRNLTYGINLVPTMYDLARIPIPKGLSGKSLKPILTGQTVKVSRNHIAVESSSGYQAHDGRYRYTAFTRGDKKETLMDILSDPGKISDKSTDPAYRTVKSHLCSLLMRDLSKITQNAPVIR